MGGGQNMPGGCIIMGFMATLAWQGGHAPMPAAVMLCGLGGTTRANKSRLGFAGIGGIFPIIPERRKQATQLE